MAVKKRTETNGDSEAEIKRELEREIDSAQKRLKALQAKAPPRDRARLEVKIVALKTARAVIGHEFIV